MTKNVTAGHAPKKPHALIIVGVLWFALGVSGLAYNAARTRGMQFPDGNWVSLLVGIGLLSGWRMSRWFALCASGCTFVFMVPFLFWSLAHPDRIVFRFPLQLIVNDGPHETISLAVLVMILLTFLVTSGWMFLVLIRRDVRQTFQPALMPTVN